MMDWTDRHCRHFHRLLTSQALLYTEMINTGAILYGDAARHLSFGTPESPVALQLGGSDPDALARSAELAEKFGYVEVNLNCGCPSDRVQEGRFGACLMLEPERVAAGVARMRSATSLPVTVKCRIGVDDSAEYPFLRQFVTTVAEAGCSTFIVHARKAWLKGLSPKENREIPPLRYEAVHQLKREFPGLEIILNGGLKTLDQCREQAAHVDGLMLGREAYENPWILTEADHHLFGHTPAVSREAILQQLRPYIVEELAAGAQLGHITRHILGLYRGMPGGRAFRRILSEGNARSAGIAAFDAALEMMTTLSLSKAA